LRGTRGRGSESTLAGGALCETAAEEKGEMH